MKEGQALEVIKALETSRDATLAEKIDLEKSMQDYATRAKDMETQIDTMKAESERAASIRIIDLQKEKDDVLTQYSLLMSEKGNSFPLKVQRPFVLKRKIKYVNLMHSFLCAMGS